MWLLLGRTAAWTDELNPPAPSITDVTLDDVIGAKRCTLQWVSPSPTGEITLIGPSGEEKWTAYTDEATAVAAGCHWVMVTGEVLGDEIPTTTFRQLGFFSGLVPTAGNEGLNALSAAQIQSVGYVESIENRQAYPRTANSMYRAINIFEF